jgi:molybdate transport system ATP-binding protein
LLFATHRREEIVPEITHELVLEKGRIVWSGQRRIDARSRVLDPLRQNTLLRVETPALRLNGSKRTLVKIEGADVFLERKKVLANIDWEICSGQHWAVLGRNGAGKSTLLKLAFGDVFAAWGSKVSRFEFTAKDSIWQLKKRVGYVGPDLQANYRRVITGAEVVGSGFYGTIGRVNRLRGVEMRKVMRLLNKFGARELGTKSATQMSYGELRKLLLLRAMVHEPELLICDEPFDGLDAVAKSDFRAMLEAVIRAGTSVVMVTHHVGDIPHFITHGLLLENGRVVIQGQLESVRTAPVARGIFAGGL